MAVRFGDGAEFFGVRVDGDLVLDCDEAWAGTPGRVVRYDADGSGARACPCGSPFKHEWQDGALVELPAVECFRSLIEYDRVDVERCSSRSARAVELMDG